MQYCSGEKADALISDTVCNIKIRIHTQKFKKDGDKFKDIQFIQIST